jgi:hypothetical protein
MSSTTSDMDIRSYIVALEEQLDDLPEEDRRELLEDLEQHITEVAAEGEGTLSDRLGIPETYAAELRLSAGLPPRAAPEHVSRVDFVRRRVARWLDIAPVRAVRDFLPELRPGWWVLRGYLMVVVLDLIMYRNGHGGVPSFIPWFGGPLFGVIAIGVAVVASVAYGRRPTHGLRRTLTGIANAAVVVGALAAASAAAQYNSMPIEYAQETSIPWLHHEDESPISNICAYDSKLRPQGKVLLYDQSGRPIDNLAAPEYGEGTVPGAELERSLGNAYPRRQQVIDPATGQLVDFECPTFDDGEEPVNGGSARR